jgi:hypothetical protein
MARRITFLLLPVLLVAGACSSGGDEPGGEEGTADLGDVELVAALTPFDSCDALLQHLTAEASERVGPYGLDGDQPYFLEGDVATMEDSAAGADVDALQPRSLPSAPVATTVPTSGTNTQEAFVDEPDIVKTTADRLLVVDDNRLRIVDLTGDQPVARGSVELPGWDSQILVVGDRVLALGSADTGEVWDETSDSTWAPYGTGAATLTEIDVSDPDAPTVVHTLTVEGGYLNARLVGETARVVLSAAHPTFPFVYPSDDSPTGRRIAEEANRRLVEEATLDDWLPTARLDDQDVDLIDCAAVEAPLEFSGFGFLSVLTVDLTQPLATPPATTVLADGQTVYASAESLYVATTRPPELPIDDLPQPLPLPTTGPTPVEDYVTALHRFDITGTGPATWIASGEVPGHLLDQFSMSEQEGRLRVATTEGAPWDGGESSSSRVAVLETDGQELVEVGAVDGLGATEQIYTVRFLGDTGYVVTFRQTDPLFVIDLSDPTAPTLQGELEIPGYSAYLHPIDEGHLLGIGQEADASGMTQGLQASVFDVSDPTHPTRVDQVVFPNEYSDAEYDHHAFLWWGPTGQAVLPLTYAETVVLSVGPDHVDEQGRVALPGGQQVRRNVVVGDRLLTVGADTLVTSDLATLAPLSQIPL